MKEKMFGFGKAHVLVQLVVVLLILAACTSYERGTSPYDTPRKHTYVPPQAVMMAPVMAGAALGNPGSQQALMNTAARGASRSFAEWLFDVFGITTRRPHPDYPR